MKSFKWILLALGMMALVANQAYGAVSTVREDPENPFVSVVKSTAYGSLFGLLVGSAIMLADRYDDAVFKISFIGGTALGLGYGLYHVSTRPAETTAALIRMDGGGASLGIPAMGIAPNKQGVRVETALFAYRF